tara:strand:+ start:345 stop:581 length:237 start_codon:yes stop_codon:yes gene_type:complete
MMNNYLPVEGMDGFYRDIHSGAIVNKNNLEYDTYISNRKKMTEDKQKFESLQVEVVNIKSDVNEIKSMLNSITELLNK